MTQPRKPKENFLDTDVSGETQTAEQPQRIDTGDQEIDTVFAAFPQNEACIELYRTTEKGGKPAFLEDLCPSDFTMGYVCRNYGGGKYKAKGKYKDGSFTDASFDIEGPPFPVKRKIPQGNPETGPHPERAAVQPVELPRREDGSFDMAAVMSAMMNMMRTMIQESKGSKAEWLAELKEMREIFGHQEKPQSPVAESISILKQGIELGSAAGNDGGIPWMLIVDKLQGPVTDLIAALTRKPTVVNQGQPITGPETERPVKPTQPQPEGGSMNTIFMGSLRSMLPMLVTGAAQSANVEGGNEEFYCDFLLEQIPMKYYATAKEWLEKPDCIDQLEKFNVGVKVYRGWFDRLQLELLRALNERLADDASRTLQPDSASDVTTDRSTDL